MRERAIVIGDQPRMVGILTESSGHPHPSTPALVLINAGLVHRVGPNRLYVRIARRMAELGYPALRLDLSGRGDSDVRRDGRSFLESSVIEIRQAISQIHARLGVERFVVAGICSGAVNAIQAAAAEPRVVGALAIDAPAYPTARYYVRHYLARIGQPDSWRNLLARVRRVVGPSGSPLETEEEPEYRVIYGGDIVQPPRAEAAALLQGIVDQGTRLAFIFSGSWSTVNYERQIHDAFPAVVRTGRVSVRYFPQADHTFTRLHHQELLLGAVGDWMAAGWPAAGSDAA